MVVSLFVSNHTIVFRHSEYILEVLAIIEIPLGRTWRIWIYTNVKTFQGFCSSLSEFIFSMLNIRRGLSSNASSSFLLMRTMPMISNLQLQKYKLPGVQLLSRTPTCWMEFKFYCLRLFQMLMGKHWKRN